MVYGNLAYQHDYWEEENTDRQKRQSKNTAMRQRTKNAVKKPNTLSKNQKNNKHMSYAGKVMCVLAATAAAIFMIVQFVEVNETQTDLADAKKQYSFEQSVTEQKNFELEQSIDLSKIEKEATTRLGMRRPEKYQTVYIDVKQDDKIEKTANEVEGVANRLSSWFKSTVSHIVDFFSI